MVLSREEKHRDTWFYQCTACTLKGRNQFPGQQVNPCWLDEVDNWMGDHLGNNAVQYCLWSQAVVQRLFIMLPSSTSMVVFVGWVSVHLNLTWGFSLRTPDSSLIKNPCMTQRGTSLLFIEYYVVPYLNKVATTKNCNVKMEKNMISKSWTHEQCNYCCSAHCSTVWAMNPSGS